MTVELFLSLLVFFSTATSLITEALKKLIGNDFPCNILVLIVAMIVGTLGTMFCYLTMEIPYSFVNVIYALLMGIANWIGAMVGYDKVKQLISQIGA